ncbi:MAG: shikimate dehydrogenase [Pontibacterium sp.]
MTDKYVVVGNPIAHSKSPSIHAEFARVSKQDISYEHLLAPLDGFDDSISAFFGNGGQGANVTVPFKENAYAFAKGHTQRALCAGAVNTLFIHPETGEVWGDNTDGAGLVTDLTVNAGCSLEGKRVLVLGAGGAVRGVLQPILAQNPSSVTVANRTVAKAELLAELMAEFGNINACRFEDLKGEFDVIINGTSASLANDVPPVPSECVGASTWCYDMMYGAELTAFSEWALAQGAYKAIDGLGMLVEQAAEAFYVWRDVRPSTASVHQQLRAELEKS